MKFIDIVYNLITKNKIIAVVIFIITSGGTLFSYIAFFSPKSEPLFSDTQVIRWSPDPFLQGNTKLNLDDVISLYYNGIADNNSIKLRLGAPPMAVPNPTSDPIEAGNGRSVKINADDPNLSIKNLEVWSGGRVVEFNRTDKAMNIINIADRSFTVTLDKIEIIASEPIVREYTFLISERKSKD